MVSINNTYMGIYLYIVYLHIVHLRIVYLCFILDTLKLSKACTISSRIFVDHNSLATADSFTIHDAGKKYALVNPISVNM